MVKVERLPKGKPLYFFIRNFWYKSHHLIDIEIPIFEIALFLEILLGIFFAFLITLLSEKTVFIVLTLANYLIYAYNGESIRSILRESPTIYKTKDVYYKSYVFLTITQKNDLFLIGVSKTLLIILLTGLGQLPFWMISIDIFLTSILLLVTITEVHFLIKLVTFIFCVGIYFLLGTVNDLLLSGISLGIGIGLLVFIKTYLKNYRFKRFLSHHKIFTFRNLTIGFIMKSFYYTTKKTLFSITIFFLTMIFLKHFDLPVRIAPLFALMTFFEVIIYAQINLYEKGKGKGAVLFQTQSKVKMWRGIFNQFTVQCLPWIMAFVALFIIEGVKIYLQIFVSILWLSLLIVYTVNISEKIIIYRHKKPQFFEEYIAMFLIILIGMIP